MPRWLTSFGFVLAPLLACSVISTLVLMAKIMAPTRGDPESESEFIMGRGPQPTIRGVLRDSGPRLDEKVKGEEEDLHAPLEEEERPDSEDESPEPEEEEEELGVEVEVQADNDDNPRPRKHPKGQRWYGWPKQQTARTAVNDKKQPILPRNVNAKTDPWWRKSNLCFEVDFICHERKENEWFYYSPPPSSSSSSSQQQNNEKDKDQLLFQPTMELKSAPAKYDGGKDRGETRVSIKVSHSTNKLKPEDIISFEENGQHATSFVKKTSGSDGNSNSNHDKCHISSSPTHVVLQSLFNDMIGEFYSRTLLRLYHFMTDDVVNTNDNGTNMPWEQDIQFYVHIPYGNKIFLDGHKLLLSGMLSNPDSPAAKSFVDLFVQEEEEAAAGDVSSSSSSDNDCQCYEKMVFCGYDVYTHKTNVLSKDLEPAIDDDDRSDDNDDVTELSDANDDKNAVSSRTFDYDLKHTLWAAAKLDRSVDLDTGSCGRNSGSRGVEYECQEWSGLRNFLSTNFLKHYPTLERDIVEQRREYLLNKGAIDKRYNGNTKEFTVIGLTQRTYRRSWINLPEIIEKCDAASFERAVCVEVNVENTSSPLEQLILHRSLDVMIGVHGAQLTQAILLPPHAHVLELLPWITNYIRGKWVQTTNGPTPLGVIFHNTDLNHLGYSLDRSSVPLCEGVNEEAEQLCFLKQRKKFIWENRDFMVESKAVLQYIEQFVLYGRDIERTCDELKDQLDGRFVMYNIWCAKPKYWYPGFSEGEKACIYGVGYPIDHIDPIKKDIYLFDSRDDCCAAYQQACPAETPKIQLSLGNNTSLSVW
eukprot:CAMPEP_0172322110 /NCGR_PEP_ID=MMETSP1058-20130122/45032_1 /TAXON_ID=83371 /ORGANISM="Detonula confervacea, Strain CCMP 353" /LENGTH=811 /DNA_ID=CAMNT_0013037759 /DNA_START=151 /DNA_END=2583 /DNA_ORIENTATION=+